MFFLPGNINFSCKLSHHPILGHYELIKKKRTPLAAKATQVAAVDP